MAQTQGKKPQGAGGKFSRASASRPQAKPGQAEREFQVSPQDVEEILRRNGEKIVSIARSFAREISSIKSHQLRTLYGSFLKIESRLASLPPSQLATEFQLLRPKVAYMAARIAEQGSQRQSSLLRTVLDHILREAAARIGQRKEEEAEQARQVASSVLEFVEAVVAYHRGR